MKIQGSRDFRNCILKKYLNFRLSLWNFALKIRGYLFPESPKPLPTLTLRTLVNEIYWENENLKQYLFLGEDSISWYGIAIESGEYYILDKPSGSVMCKCGGHEHFLILCSFISFLPLGGGCNKRTSPVKNTTHHFRGIVYRVCWPFILHRWEVMRMDKKPFDFKDLMSFGMFILALLTFILFFFHCVYLR